MKIILTKLCLVCGKEFAKPYSCGMPEWKNKRKYCSKECSNKGKENISSWNKNIPWTQEQREKIALVKKGKHYSLKTEFKKGLIPWNKSKTIRQKKDCNHCKKEFLAWLSGKGLYCSNQCKNLGMKSDNPWKECVVCKKKFQKKEDMKRWLTRKVCSRQCQYKIQGLKGKKNPNYRGGISPLNVVIRGLSQYRVWVISVFKRDDYTCQICKIRGGDLNADHIKPFSRILKEYNIKSREDAINCEELWDTGNGRTLCLSCHKVETNKIRHTL